jgi:hypothetical protein
MKYFELLRIFALSTLMILAAASLAPVMAEDPGGCPDYPVTCPGGTSCSCAGTQVGNTCSYDRGCQNGGCCKSNDDLIE